MTSNHNQYRFTATLLACLLFCCLGFNTSSHFHRPEAISNKTAAVANDSVQLKNNITAFLRWYKTNLHKANRFPLLAKDGKDCFMISKNGCTGYLNFLKSSNRVSSKYIGYWQTWFNDKAIMLKKEKIKSDIPDGFDMDLVLITQEPDLVLEKIDSLKFNVVSLSKSAAVMKLTLPSDSSIDYEFEMQKSKGRWLIDYISTPNFD